MNYIQHLNGFFEKLSMDDRPNPTHVSLYLALFQIWNINRFVNPLSITRSCTIKLSRIGSRRTYHKCLKDLSVWGYVLYQPSRNPLKGSLVHMFHFWTSAETAEPETSSILGHVVGLNLFKSGTCCSDVVIPSINSNKHLNNKTKKEKEKEKEKTPTPVSALEDLLFSEKEKSSEKKSETIKTKRKKVAPKKENPEELILPFLTPQFEESWSSLIGMPKWKNKQISSLKMALKKLAAYDEEFAIHLVELAIANEWQGVVFLDTELKYNQWKLKKEKYENKTMERRFTSQGGINPENTEPVRNYQERF